MEPGELGLAPTHLPHYHRSYVSQPKIGQAEMLWFHWKPFVASRAYVFYSPTTQEAPWSRIILAFVSTTAYLCIPGQLSITDSMDTVKISKRVCLCQRIKQMTFWEIGVGLCAWLSVRCASTLFPFLLSFKTLRRLSKAASAFTLGWGSLMLWAGIPRLWSVPIIIKVCFLGN